MICASVYLLVFIRNLLMHLAEKILLIQPLTFGGDYLGSGLIDHIQKMTMAAIAMADMKVCAQRS